MQFLLVGIYDLFIFENRFRLTGIASLIIGKWGKLTIFYFKHLYVRFSTFSLKISGPVNRGPQQKEFQGYSGGENQLKRWGGSMLNMSTAMDWESTYTQRHKPGLTTTEVGTVG